MLSLLKPTKGQTLLDVSCGKGYLVASAKKFGLDAVGIELSNTALKLAAENFPDCKFLKANALLPEN